MMNCQTMKQEWSEYLEGGLANELRALMDTHLETCDACQALPVVGEQLATMLRQRLPQPTAPASLRTRVEELIAADVSPERVAPERKAGSTVTDWLSNWLGSPWAPRLAMVAVLAFLIMVPFKSQTPALAEEAVDRHENHVSASSAEQLSCCKSLHLQPGDILGDPSRGARVPDLSSDGLELVVTTRCGYKGKDVTILAYRSAGEESFSL
jgi:anti-sigma factor RsiW